MFIDLTFTQSKNVVLIKLLIIFDPKYIYFLTLMVILPVNSVRYFIYLSSICIQRHGGAVTTQDVDAVSRLGSLCAVCMVTICLLGSKKHAFKGILLIYCVYVRRRIVLLHLL